MHKRLGQPRFLFVYPLAALLFAVGHSTFNVIAEVSAPDPPAIS